MVATQLDSTPVNGYSTDKVGQLDTQQNHSIVVFKE